MNYIIVGRSDIVVSPKRKLIKGTGGFCFASRVSFPFFAFLLNVINKIIILEGAVLLLNLGHFDLKVLARDQLIFSKLDFKNL